jgi:predicted ATPase with chaperone activity
MIVADPAWLAWADLADCDKIETPHLAEAIQYRPRRMV